MVVVTNRFGLPVPLVNALAKQRYTKGAARASVTQLIDSPRIDLLRKQNGEQITVDVSDRLWALLGTALHSVLEAGADLEHIPEERLFADVEGWRISGGIDLQTLRAGDPPVVGIRDYKLCSVWSVMNPKPAWTRQLNSYAWLVREAKGWLVGDIQIVAILRDWSRRDSIVKAGYPKTPVLSVPVELWSPETADAYVRSRVKAHQDANRAAQWGEELPPCSDEDRWARPSTWAVTKPGRKTAVRVFDNQAAAEEFSAATPGTGVTVRPGAATRCEGDYCSVSAWCEQYQATRRAAAEAAAQRETEMEEVPA